jgi:hypothetical protein
MMIRKQAMWLAAVILVGCGGDDPFDPDRPRRSPATQFGGQLAPAIDVQPGAAKPEPPPKGPGPDPSLPPPPPSQAATSDPAPPSELTPPPDPDRVQTAARPGVTGKGQGYGDGPIATPVRVYFSTRERIVFDIQITQAMKLYKTMHERFPRTHEEFMEKIIKENGIQLPELRPGDRYVYDAEKAATMRNYDPTDPPLMVERSR